MNATYQEISVNSLTRGRYQPRIHFDNTALQELAESIRTQGLIEPLVVREIAAKHYEIIAGERRWRAAIPAGMTTVPCMVGQYSDKQAAALTLVENIQRQDLNLIEEAAGYRRLMNEFHFQQDDIAALVSKSRSHIANLLRLLNLDPEIQELLITGKLSLGHARLLVGMEKHQQCHLAEQVIRNEWSVRFLEDIVKNLKTAQKPVAPPQKSRDVAYLETRLAEQIGTPVQIISGKDSGGHLEIKFFDNETLTGLLERLGLRYD